MIKYSFVPFSIISKNSLSFEILNTSTLVKAFQFSSFSLESGAYHNISNALN